MSETFNAGHPATCIFLSILETNQRYGSDTISKIITGNKENKKLEHINTKILVSFDTCTEFNQNQIKAIIQELIRDNYLERHHKFKSLILTSKAISHVFLPANIDFPKEILEEELFVDRLTATHESTQILLENGMKPKEIAEKRGLSINTIYHHIANLIFHKKIKNIREYLTKESEETIKPVIKNYDKTPLKEIKALLPEKISYNDIKLTLAKNLQLA